MKNPFHCPEVSVSECQGGHQVIFRFANNFGASVVRHSFSYGREQGLWELAVIKWEGQKWGLTYETDVTDDVIGHLSVEEVNALLDQIQNLEVSP